MAVGDRTTLNQLHEALRNQMTASCAPTSSLPTRPTVTSALATWRHSLADVGKARRLLGYQPTHDVSQGMAEAVAWYVANRRLKTGLNDRPCEFLNANPSVLIAPRD